MRSTTAASRPFAATRCAAPASEGDLAIHRPRRNGCNAILDADPVGQLSMHSWSTMVESMSREDFLSPSISLLNDHVDGFRNQASAQNGRHLSASGHLGQSQIAGDPFGQPANSACADRP
jgi:hypothetical protein